MVKAFIHGQHYQAGRKERIAAADQEWRSTWQYLFWLLELFAVHVLCKVGLVRKTGTIFLDREDLPAWKES